MKTITTTILIVLLVVGQINTGLANYGNSKTKQLPAGGGIITIEDDDLYAVADDPSTDIIKVNIYAAGGQLVLSFDGCNDSSCSYDVSALPQGDYFTLVFTNYGNSGQVVTKD